MLEYQNAHPRDKNISFEEASHTYTVKGDSTFKSVTTWIHGFFPHFDADKVISKMRQGKNWNKDNKYYEMTDAQIKELWKNNGATAAQLGTAMHLNIERYYNGLSFSDDFIDSTEYKLFQEYLADHQHLKAYRTEWTVYSRAYKLAGSIDMVYCDPQEPGKYIIADWKRSKEIKTSNRWEKGYPPLQDIDNCNYWHYTLQLNVYRTILETYYKLTVTGMFLVVLHPNQKHYQKIIVPRIENEVVQMFHHRGNELKTK